MISLRIISATISIILLNYNEVGSESPFRSLLPVPNGPLYGYPYGPETFATRFLPLTVSGTCKNGTVYTITKLQDLKDLRAELECVFNAGVAPDKIPTGPLYGEFEKFYNTPILNTLIKYVFWEGKYIQKEECADNNTFLGWNVIPHSPRPLYPFLFSVKPIPVNLAPGEYNNGQDVLVIDYSVNTREKCPNYRDLMDEAGETSKPPQRDNPTRDPISIYPYLDVMRFVGKQEDGGLIYLCKAYMQDLFREDKQAVTITFWTVLSYDESVMKNFASGDPLPPLKETFKYMHPGGWDLLLRLFPFDNLMTTPVKTASDMARGGMRFGRELWRLVQDIAGKGFKGYSRKFRNQYNSDRLIPGRNLRG